MPLTPADIHHASFSKPPIGRRGYDQEDVDSFLDEVENEMIRLLEENSAFHERVQRDGAVAQNGLGDAVAMLERMQELRARAEDDARGLHSELEHARRAASAPAAPPEDGRVDRVLSMARRTADEHMRDANREADEVLASARAEAGDIAGEARLRADVVEGEARRSHAEAMSNLSSERGALLDEIDRLGQLARGYQEALAGHIDHQLKELGGDQDPRDAPAIR